jgi:hypothetical protein
LIQRVSIAVLHVTAFVIITLAFSATAARAQTVVSLPKTVRVLGPSTPLRIGPGTDNPIVVTVGEGTLLDVVARAGDWYSVTVAPDISPDGRAHVAYVLARLVAVAPPMPSAPVQPVTAPMAAPPPAPVPVPIQTAPVPSTVPVPAIAPVPVSVPPPPQAPPPTPLTSQAPPREPAASERRGDVAVGYYFFETNAALGFAASDGWAIGKHVDFIAETTLSHGSPFGISANVFGAFGGVRIASASRYGKSARGIFEIEGGLLHLSASDGFESVTENALGIKIGGGVDVSASRIVAIRPQLDWVIGHSSDLGWTGDVTFTVSVVFRLFKE